MQVNIVSQALQAAAQLPPVQKSRLCNFMQDNAPVSSNTHNFKVLVI